MFGNFLKKTVGYGKQQLQRIKINKFINLKRNQSAANQMMSRGQKTLKDVGATTGSQTRNMVAGINNRFANPGMSTTITTPTTTSRKLVDVTRKKLFSTVGSLKNQIIVGSTAMAGLAFMNGGMSQAQDIMYERYMRDSRYSSRLLTQTNLGQASGNSALNMGNHVGLSLALSRTRHGR